MALNISKKLSGLNKKLGSKEVIDKKRGKSEWGNRQPLLPLFKRVRNFTSIFSVLIFVLTLGGSLFVATIDSSLTRGTDASLPPRVRDAKKEYTDIKDKYAKFDFDMFRKITGKTPLPENKEEDAIWGEASEIFFGLSYLDDFRQSVKNMDDSADASANTRIQAPQIAVTGWMMTSPNDAVVILTNAGVPGEWYFKRKGGKWTCSDVPNEFELSEMETEPKSGAPYFMLNYKAQPQMKFKVMLGSGYLEEGARTVEGGSPSSGTPYIKLGKEDYLYLQPPITQTTSFGQADMTAPQNRIPLPNADDIHNLGLPENIVNPGMPVPQQMPAPQIPVSVPVQPQVPGIIPR